MAFGMPSMLMKPFDETLIIEPRAGSVASSGTRNGSGTWLELSVGGR